MFGLLTGWLSPTLKPVVSLIPVHTSLVVFCWSLASCFHFLTVLVDAAAFFGVRRTRLWSDLPSGERALALHVQWLKGTWRYCDSFLNGALPSVAISAPSVVLDALLSGSCTFRLRALTVLSLLWQTLNSLVFTTMLNQNQKPFLLIVQKRKYNKTVAALDWCYIKI